MRSPAVASLAGATRVVSRFTDGENTFRFAKLRPAALVAYKTFADAAGKGTVFVITLVAARRLTPWAFGVFGLGTTLGWMLSVVADFGVQLHLARAVAQQPAAAGRLLRRWWRARWIATCGSVAALVAVLLASRADASIAAPLVAFAGVYACTSLVEFLNYFYRGLSRTDIESSLTIAQRAATLVLGLAVLVWRPDVTWLAAAMLAPAAAALAWSARTALTMAGPHESASPAMVPPRDTFARDVFPIGIGIVLSALYFRIDVLLVQAWGGTEMVARYNAVFRLIDALRLVPAAVLAVVLPSLCNAVTLEPLARVSAAVTAFAVAAAAVLWASAGWLVPLLFGAPYASAVPAFRVLAWTFPLLSLNFALTHQLVAWNRERPYAAICAIALVVNVALNAWLIPAWSIQGAAWATLGTEVCVTAGCATVLWGRS